MDNDVLQNLKLHVLIGNNPKSLEGQEWQKRAYDFWHKLWLNTFNELTGDTQLHSDDFLRQNESCFLTYKDQVIAYHGYSFFNINLPSHLSHSYFKAYPPEAIQKLKDMKFNEVMVMGYYSVGPEWRKTANAGWIAEVLAFFAYKRFQESTADTLITITRNNRKVNELASRYGSRCLTAKQSLHNVEVDLVYTLKKEVRDHDNPFIKNAINKLWKERVVHADPIEEPVRKVA